MEHLSVINVIIIMVYNGTLSPNNHCMGYILGPVLLLQSEAVTSLLTNGSAAFKWKLHCH